MAYRFVQGMPGVEDIVVSMEVHHLWVVRPPHDTIPEIAGIQAVWVGLSTGIHHNGVPLMQGVTIG